MIIPSINRATLEEAQKDVRVAESFLPDGGWLHLDVADGQFTPWKSWGDPSQLKDLNTRLSIEVHLMVANIEDIAPAWMVSGVKRLIVPIQVMKNAKELYQLAKQYEVELMPSFDMSVPIVNMEQYSWAQYVGVLAVDPGESGQSAKEDAFDRVKFLRESMPGVKIEFDGGVDLHSGERALRAGADILISGHYLFEGGDPKNNFSKLSDLE